MIAAVFFGSRVFEDATPIERAMVELIGSADVGGRRAGVRAPGEAHEPADGALVVVHSGGHTGVPKRADALAKDRGLKPVVIAEDRAVCDWSGQGPVPCSCPRRGWLGVDGHRYQFCRSAGRRRNAETVAYLLQRAAEGVHVVGRGFVTGPDDDDVYDMTERLEAAGIEWTIHLAGTDLELRRS